MASIPALSDPSVAQLFFGPIHELLPSCRHSRSCPSLADSTWLELLIARVLFASTTGRAFLQEHAALLAGRPASGLFFESLKSPRRLALLTELNSRLQARLSPLASDRFAPYPLLHHFDLYAGDGHWHAAASHDPVCDGTKFATGHFFGINLRHGGVFHLATADSLHRHREHDMRALKRLAIATLRQGAPTGRKVLWVWDKAGIDFRQWYQWKHSAGVYFVSRAKDNMVRDVIGEPSWDKADPINASVLDDVLVATSQGVTVRWVRYSDPVDGEIIELITSEMTLPPGLIVHLYRVRWDIEKTFDLFKNKFVEKKSWATSPVAKAVHAQFLCLAHTLLDLFEKTVVQPNGVENVAENARRRKRISQLESQIAKTGQVVPEALRTLLRCTQHSVKFIRWLRSCLVRPTSWAEAMPDLRAFYASL